MEEGDIYGWAWKHELKRNNFGAFGDYHCKSRVAIVHDGKLLDTYWMDFGSSFLIAGWAGRRSGANSVSECSVDLTFIANLSDLVEIRHGEEKYFDRADIVDLRHANCTKAPVYKRKGAERSLAIMEGMLREKIDAAEREASSAARSAERYRSELDVLMSTKNTSVSIY